MKKLMIAFCVLAAPSLYGQSLQKNWEADLNTSLTSFEQCSEDVGLVSTCHQFSGESLKTVYGINDFYAKEQNRYMLIDEIYTYLESGNRWTLLGKAYDQKALEDGQKHANAGKAVVAVKKVKADDYGHMALILPGELSPSGSWNLRVPNSASFFTHQKEKSYVAKKLSYAFNPADQGYVLLYVRNY